MEKLAFSTDFTRKSGVFLQILREKLAFFGVNFILQEFCPCKKNDKYQVWSYYENYVLLFLGESSLIKPNITNYLS